MKLRRLGGAGRLPATGARGAIRRAGAQSLTARIRPRARRPARARRDQRRRTDRKLRRQFLPRERGAGRLYARRADNSRVPVRPGRQPVRRLAGRQLASAGCVREPRLVGASAHRRGDRARARAAGRATGLPSLTRRSSRRPPGSGTPRPSPTIGSRSASSSDEAVPAAGMAFQPAPAVRPAEPSDSAAVRSSGARPA